jgi:AraC-like DNA-binding protein
MKHEMNITVNSQYAEILINFLISSYIPFEMSFGRISGSNQANSAKIPQQTDISENNVYSPQKLDAPALENELVATRYKSVDEVIERYLTKNFDKPIPNTSQIAEECGVTTPIFRNYVTLQYGKPFYKLYIEHKMEYAAKLLKKGYKCNEVTVMIGYSEKSCIKFNKMFQKHFGMTPKKYQMSQK